MSSRFNKQKLERVIYETGQWLLRDDESVHPRDVYSGDILELLGPNLGNDSYVRTVRRTIRYLLDDMRDDINRRKDGET